MKNFKKIALRLFVTVEVVYITVFYFLTSQGYIYISEDQRKSKKLDQDIAELEIEISNLKNQIERYAQTDFYKEKIARQELQLAGLHDDIYFIDDNI